MAFDTTTDAVGLAAAGVDAVIYEMAHEQFDLEELFLELTTPKERRMNTLIRAELMKLRTLRSFWWTVAATLAFVPVSIAISMHGGSGKPRHRDHRGLPQRHRRRLVGRGPDAHHRDPHDGRASSATTRSPPRS